MVTVMMDSRASTNADPPISRVRIDRAQGATFVELFFDLVFVYAITQLTSTMIHDLTWAGVGRGLLVFWLVWWAWTQFTWTLNLADTEHTVVRLLTLAATAVAFFLAQAVPDAFTTAGAWFGIAYAVVRLLGMGVHSWVLSGDEAQTSAFSLFASLSLVGLALVVVGGFVSDLTLWFWLGAVVADLVTVLFAGRGAWSIASGHFAERHGLIVIIALGESLIAAGVATSELARDAQFAVTLVGAVVAACALWWVYFGSLHGRLELALESSSQGGLTQGKFARDVFSLWHAVIVIGVIGVAIGFEEAIAHPDELLETGPALALTVGVGLFVGGLAAAAWRANVRDAVLLRLSLAILVLALTPLATRVAAAVVLWTLAALTIVMVLLEDRRPNRPKALIA